MARYTGRKATIEAYKRERKRVMGYIHELESLGVSVPKELIPQQGGKVKAPDVAKLKRTTRETIMRKSTLVITEKSYTGKTSTEVYKGKDVEKVVRREKTKRSREMTEKIKSGEYYHDPRTGDIYDKKSRQKVGHRKVTPKEKREYEERLRGGGDGGPIGGEDGTDEGGIIEEPPVIDEDLRTYDEFIDTLESTVLDSHDIVHGKYGRKERQSSDNAEKMLEYIKRAVEEYKSKKVVGAMLNAMKLLGYTFEMAISYIDEVYDKFTSMLTHVLPIENRDEYDKSIEDDTGYDTEEEYEE